MIDSKQNFGVPRSPKCVLYEAKGIFGNHESLPGKPGTQSMYGSRPGRQRIIIATWVAGGMRHMEKSMALDASCCGRLFCRRSNWRCCVAQLSGLLLCCLLGAVGGLEMETVKGCGCVQVTLEVRPLVVMCGSPVFVCATLFIIIALLETGYPKWFNSSR